MITHANESLQRAREHTKASEAAGEAINKAVASLREVETSQHGVIVELNHIVDGRTISHQDASQGLEASQADAPGAQGAASKDSRVLLHTSLKFDPESMGTSEQTIDDQHRKLIEIINRLEEAEEQNHGPAEIKPVLDFMERYVIDHFKYEEQLMETRKCSAAKKNIEAHRALVEKYTEWRKAYEAGGSKTAMVAELHEFLSKWIVGHICRVDTCLRDCKKGHTHSAEAKGSVEMF